MKLTPGRPKKLAMGHKGMREFGRIKVRLRCAGFVLIDPTVESLSCGSRSPHLDRPSNARWQSFPLPILRLSMSGSSSKLSDEGLKRQPA